LTTNVAASGNYFSTGLGTITFTFTTPQTAFALLWGSIDTGNSITLSDGFTVTGSEVSAAAGAIGGANGFQGPGGSAYVVIDSSTPFTTVTAASSTISFEFAAIAAADAPFTLASPEPSSLLLLGLGFGLVGLAFRHRAKV
jgi:hypothetical protein